MKKILLLTTCLLGGLVAADLSNLPTDDQDGAVALPSMPSSLEISTAAATALLEVAAPSAGDKGDRKRRMPTETDLRDRGDRKKRAAPVECTIAKANSLAEWFCYKPLSKSWGRYYGKYYDILISDPKNDGSRYGFYVVYLRETDMEVCEISSKREGRPAVTFKRENEHFYSYPDSMRKLLSLLQNRYLKQDMVSQMTDAAFQRAGIFPGLTFFNNVVDSEIRKNQRHLGEARKLLPCPYDTEFVKPEMPSDIKPYSFFRAVSLYQIIDSHSDLYCHLPSISTAIRDLQRFYDAVASDSEINQKHGDFIKSLLDNAVCKFCRSICKSHRKSLR